MFVCVYIIIFVKYDRMVTREWLIYLYVIQNECFTSFKLKLGFCITFIYSFTSFIANTVAGFKEQVTNRTDKVRDSYTLTLPICTRQGCQHEYTPLGVWWMSCLRLENNEKFKEWDKELKWMHKKQSTN